MHVRESKMYICEGEEGVRTIYVRERKKRMVGEKRGRTRYIRERKKRDEREGEEVVMTRYSI